MSYTIEEILILADDFESVTSTSLVKCAKAKQDVKKKFPFWLKFKKTKDSDSANDSKNETFCVTSQHSKDKKDHLPINTEAQAKSVLNKIKLLKVVPDWFSGTLDALVKAVNKKITTKYPKIDISKKP